VNILTILYGRTLLDVAYNFVAEEHILVAVVSEIRSQVMIVCYQG
jgi:hypothetical protein